MDIELVKKKLEGVHDWQEFYLHEVGEMLTCAMEHIAKLEAAQHHAHADVANFCPNCGYQVTALICTQCGTPIPATQVA